MSAMASNRANASLLAIRLLALLLAYCAGAAAADAGQATHAQPVAPELATAVLETEVLETELLETEVVAASPVTASVSAAGAALFEAAADTRGAELTSTVLGAAAAAVLGAEAAAVLGAEAAAGVPNAEDICAPPGELSNAGRRRPGQGSSPVLEYELPPCDGSRVPAWSSPLDLGPPVPDRWRIMDAFYNENLLDPYANNNFLKGDKPVFGEDWFVSLTLISDSVLEPRRFPVPVGNATTTGSGRLNTIGDGDQFVFNQNLIFELAVLKGDTVFRPPDYEFRFTPVFNYSDVHFSERGLLKVDPSSPDDGSGRRRREGFMGIQALFFDKHLQNVSDRFDFDSIRIGIQPFTSDFRGFLFSDSQLGIRLFGIRDNNTFQYNLAWFRRLEKDKIGRASCRERV